MNVRRRANSPHPHPHPARDSITAPSPAVQVLEDLLADFLPGFRTITFRQQEGI